MKEFPPADLYALHQRAEPFWLKQITKLQSLGAKVICDTDDYHPGVPEWHPSHGRIPLERLLEGYRMADALTVSTPFLAQAYSELNENVCLLPNYLDAEMWPEPKRDWDRLRIGYMGHAGFHKGDIHLLCDVIRPFLLDHPEVDFVAAGDERTHDILDVPKAQRLTYPGIEYHRLAEIMKMDVGLVPLVPCDFNEGKSHLKGMEYNAAGIPFIASNTAPYREWTTDNGLIATSAEEWREHLEALLDEGVRHAYRRAGRRKALDNTIQRHVAPWGDVYTQVSGDEADGLARDAIVRGALQKPSELAALIRQLQVLELRSVVEIGTSVGGMFWLLCQLATNNARLVSIDMPGAAWGGAKGVASEAKLRSHARAGQQVKVIRGDSHSPKTYEKLTDWLRGPIDLLLIDGDHTYRGVKQDFEMYAPLARLTVLHDIVHHPEAPACQVDRFWSELREKRRVEELTVDGEERGWGPWGGLGLVY